MTCWVAEKLLGYHASRTGLKFASKAMEAVPLRMGGCHTSEVARKPPEDMPGKLFTEKCLVSLQSPPEEVLGKAADTGP